MLHPKFSKKKYASSQEKGSSYDKLNMQNIYKKNT